jgi:hypothetical protein
MIIFTSISIPSAASRATLSTKCRALFHFFVSQSKEGRTTISKRHQKNKHCEEESIS